tara:strand:+ start:473 stop:661 length:189 start_codon:yes stop_codon:yes gene_type:complete
MIIELAMAGMLQCLLTKQVIVGPDLNCFYICKNGTKEYASTLKQYRCPKTLYVDMPKRSTDK